MSFVIDRDNKQQLSQKGDSMKQKLSYRELVYYNQNSYGKVRKITLLQALLGIIAAPIGTIWMVIFVPFAKKYNTELFRYTVHNEVN